MDRGRSRVAKISHHYFRIARLLPGFSWVRGYFQIIFRFLGVSANMGNMEFLRKGLRVLVYELLGCRSGELPLKGRKGCVEPNRRVRMEEGNMPQYSHWRTYIAEFVHTMGIPENEKQACIAYLVSWYKRRVLHRIKREEYEAI